KAGASSALVTTWQRKAPSVRGHRHAMLSPDQLKGYADIAVSLLGAGGLGAIVLAAIGIKKATGERPAEDRPSIGHPGLVGIAGMVAGEHFGMELLQRSAEIRDGLRALVVELENGRRTRRE